jgi:phenylacetate-CoA ligase
VRFLSSTYDRFTGRSLSYYRRILERTQWMEKEELKKLQTQKLKALLRHAYENVPYYHRILRDNGFRPSNFNRLEDMQRVPILKRSSLRLKSGELLTQNLEKSRIVASATSGTTASPLRFYLTKAEIPWHVAAELRGYGWGGYRPGDKYVHIRRVRPGDVLTRPLERLRRLTLRCKLLNTINLSEKTLASFSLTLQKFKPDYILGAAGSTNILATFLLQNGTHTIRPRGVFTYGQQLLPHYRKAIEKAFNCKVYDRYGSTEVPQIASQCGSHKGHHVADENVLVQIEKDREAAAPGEEGKVLITSLNNYAMPFIRYDIGDTGTILRDECPCGRKLSLFSPVGRDYEYFVHSDGTFTFFRDVQTVFEDLPIKDFQIVQQTYDEIVIKIVPTQGYKQGHTDFILKAINWRIADIANVRVELVDSLPVTGLGKMRHFTSKIQTTYT